MVIDGRSLIIPGHQLPEVAAGAQGHGSVVADFTDAAGDDPGIFAVGQPGGSVHRQGDRDPGVNLAHPRQVKLGYALVNAVGIAK